MREEVDRKIKVLLDFSPFFVQEEKEKLLAKIKTFSPEEKESLFSILVDQQNKLNDLNAKYAKLIKEKYEYWQDLFKKISEIL